MAKRASKRAWEAEEERLQDYELVVVFRPEVDGDGLAAAIDKRSQFVTESGGAVSTVEQWGKKRLAYPIKRFLEGSYVLMRFTLRPKLTRELEANMKISEEILRHLLLKLDG